MLATFAAKINTFTPLLEPTAGVSTGIEEDPYLAPS